MTVCTVCQCVCNLSCLQVHLPNLWLYPLPVWLHRKHHPLSLYQRVPVQVRVELSCCCQALCVHACKCVCVWLCLSVWSNLWPRCGEWLAGKVLSDPKCFHYLLPDPKLSITWPSLLSLCITWLSLSVFIICHLTLSVFIVYHQTLSVFIVCLHVESEEICVCVAVECRWMHMDRESGKGRGRWGEHERSRQEKKARVGWVIRQIQIGVVVWDH